MTAMKLLLLATASCLTISTGLFLTLDHYESNEKHLKREHLEQPSKPSELPLTSIACGSCFKPNYKGANDIWDSIARQLKDQLGSTNPNCNHQYNKQRE